MIETGGIRTTGQSKILEHHVPARDAFVEGRMKAAGGALMGKTHDLRVRARRAVVGPAVAARDESVEKEYSGGTSSGPGAAMRPVFFQPRSAPHGRSIRMPALVRHRRREATYGS